VATSTVIFYNLDPGTSQAIELTLPFIAVWRMQRFVIPTEKLLSPVVMKMNAAMGAFHSRATPYLSTPAFWTSVGHSQQAGS
jgi:hypothetical protein